MFVTKAACHGRFFSPGKTRPRNFGTCIFWMCLMFIDFRGPKGVPCCELFSYVYLFSLTAGGSRIIAYIVITIYIYIYIYLSYIYMIFPEAEGRPGMGCLGGCMPSPGKKESGNCWVCLRHVYCINAQV